MDEQAREQAFVTALTTEHFVLQNAAATTVNEANSRVSAYLLALSSTLVALGFAGERRPAVFAAIVLPVVFVVGWFTLVRLVDISAENVECHRRMNRIRGYYAGLAPQAEGYFPDADRTAAAATAATSVTSAMAWTGQTMSGRYERLAPLFTAAAMIGVVKAAVGGAAIGMLLVAAAGAPWPAAIGAAVGLAVVLVAAALLYQRRRFRVAASPAQPPTAG